MTLDDLEWPKRYSSIKKVYVTNQKNLTEDTPILSAAKCRPMILVSRNIRYMWIFAGVRRGRGINYQTTISVYACVREFEHERTFIYCCMLNTYCNIYRILFYFL